MIREKYQYSGLAKISNSVPNDTQHGTTRRFMPKRYSLFKQGSSSTSDTDRTHDKGFARAQSKVHKEIPVDASIAISNIFVSRVRHYDSERIHTFCYERGCFNSVYSLGYTFEYGTGDGLEQIMASLLDNVNYTYSMSPKGTFPFCRSPFVFEPYVAHETMFREAGSCYIPKVQPVFSIGLTELQSQKLLRRLESRWAGRKKHQEMMERETAIRQAEQARHARAAADEAELERLTNLLRRQKRALRERFDDIESAIQFDKQRTALIKRIKSINDEHDLKIDDIILGDEFMDPYSKGHNALIADYARLLCLSKSQGDEGNRGLKLRMYNALLYGSHGHRLDDLRPPPPDDVILLEQEAASRAKGDIEMLSIADRNQDSTPEELLNTQSLKYNTGHNLIEPNANNQFPVTTYRPAIDSLTECQNCLKSYHDQMLRTHDPHSDQYDRLASDLKLAKLKSVLASTFATMSEKDIYALAEQRKLYAERQDKLEEQLTEENKFRIKDIQNKEVKRREEIKHYERVQAVTPSYSTSCPSSVGKSRLKLVPFENDRSLEERNQNEAPCKLSSCATQLVTKAINPVGLYVSRPAAQPSKSCVALFPTAKQLDVPLLSIEPKVVAKLISHEEGRKEKEICPVCHSVKALEVVLPPISKNSKPSSKAAQGELELQVNIVGTVRSLRDGMISKERKGRKVILELH